MYKISGETERKVDFKDLADGMNSAAITIGDRLVIGKDASPCAGQRCRIM